MPSRRAFIRYLGCAALTPDLLRAGVATQAAQAALDFVPCQARADTDHHLAPDYHAQVLLRWGDALVAAPAPWTPGLADAAAQGERFGYNNDFVAYFPLPAGSDDSSHGLLCVNHEYTNPLLMFPGLTRATLDASMDAARTAAEVAAVGHSVVEIRRTGAAWAVVHGRYNRRVTAASPVVLSGPAAGHPRLRTAADPRGTEVAGILNPCGGGKTPWGTVLMGEENFDVAFSGATEDPVERRNHTRYGVGARRGYAWWGRHAPRFRLDHEAREANRFGWVVELDPYDPTWLPRKRTALGRFKHEAASCALAPDGRVVVYSGDDAPFEYLYRFVSAGRYDPRDRAANRDLLDRGELSVARFHDDGRLTWLPLRHGEGGLTAAHGFADQGEVLIEARRAADRLGATRLDRPEDVEANPHDGCVYALLTNNLARRTPDAANPRANNRHGHVLRLLPPGAPGPRVDHAADTFTWAVFLLAGDPARSGDDARYPATPAAGDWLSCPDNCAFDPAGRLWIATDQGAAWREHGRADGLWTCGHDTAGRPVLRRFFSAPLGAEVCGPEFTPDGRTLFLAVQHPGADGLTGSTFDQPATRWPDFAADTPPRPAVLAIRRNDGGTIGG